jgi:hypothetical protein
MINRNLAFCIGIFLIFSHKVIAEPLSHKNLGLIYTEAKSDDLDASGYGLEAEILIWDHLILGGYLASAKNKSGLEGVNSVNSRFIGIVASIVTSISESTEVYGGMDLSRVKTESETGYSSLSGSVIHKDFFVGLGFSTHSAYELSFDIYRDISEYDSETLLKTAGRYFLNNEVSVGLKYDLSTSNSSYSDVGLSFRYDFN